MSEGNIALLPARAHDQTVIKVVICCGSKKSILFRTATIIASHLGLGEIGDTTRVAARAKRLWVGGWVGGKVITLPY